MAPLLLPSVLMKSVNEFRVVRVSNTLKLVSHRAPPRKTSWFLLTALMPATSAIDGLELWVEVALQNNARSAH